MAIELKPKCHIPEWASELAVHRVETCRSFLYIQGFLSDNEFRVIGKRIEKWKASQKKGKDGY